eukprot:CAMPEP_0119384750 /NCGR_PEP_ID=MMETSP1334-20130426/87448_1 /TAXON_ID=127549 /ORGANISM="Calcidiscus leptoporus, Strain RCC1130" /LENGTH=106 /DNA_ID=CAMNT_0007405857 /DNA_START=518 /DNA_END=838 /DNA_ORIENTATION=+
MWSIGLMMSGIAHKPATVGMGEPAGTAFPAAHTTRLITAPGIATLARDCHKKVSAASITPPFIAFAGVAFALQAASAHTYEPATAYDALTHQEGTSGRKASPSSFA